ncbi:YybH family protein [Streptomyces sp. NPDC002701]|uniref:YybH family protein n=1 Tax=Streptomyces sp. NPDC002701 TaxID=3364661 RepID=UPI0036AFEDCB
MSTTSTNLSQTIDDFVAAFNEPSPDLDKVMSFFADDAVYLPGHLPERRGTAAIRKEFEPHFAGRYGTMHFAVYDKIVDEPNRRATIRWACRLDMSGESGRHVPLPLRLFARARYGGRMQWHGVDVFHFDTAGRISGKFTYAMFRLPLWERG